jgi:DNA mismatch repair ATPase MutS
VIETVLLSQTIGLSAAKNCELTPFKYISTYLNIPDCQGKESLFQAEMSRCYNMLKSLEELDKTPNQFGFNIMDEIFVSTNQYEGISGAYAIIKQLAKFGNSMHIITTHFDIITRMKNPRICKYYFTIDDSNSNSNSNSNNELVKTYKLNKGINKKHCALLLLKNKGFDPQIIKDANKMYRFITRGGASPPRKC